MNFKDMVGKTLKVTLSSDLFLDGVLAEYIDATKMEDTIHSLRFENSDRNIYVRARDVKIVEVMK